MKLAFAGEYRDETMCRGTYPIRETRATRVDTEATTMVVILMFFATATAGWKCEEESEQWMKAAHRRGQTRTKAPTKGSLQNLRRQGTEVRR
jgi:hypothetical protein